MKGGKKQMEDRNIYYDLFNLYQSHNKDFSKSQYEFENELENILNDDFKLYNDTIEKLHNLLNETNRNSYIAGFKTALELIKR